MPMSIHFVGNNFLPENQKCVWQGPCQVCNTTADSGVREGGIWHRVAQSGSHLGPDVAEEVSSESSHLNVFKAVFTVVAQFWYFLFLFFLIFSVLKNIWWSDVVGQKIRIGLTRGCEMVFLFLDRDLHVMNNVVTEIKWVKLIVLSPAEASVSSRSCFRAWQMERKMRTTLTSSVSTSPKPTPRP